MRLRLILWMTLCLLSGAALTSTNAADWHQWRGPQRNGISSEANWTTRWSGSGPRKLWTARVGMGHSSVAVANGRVYTLGNTNNQDVIYCLNADTGKLIWKYSYACSVGDPGWQQTWSGTRSTPVLDGNFVYTLSIEAHAVCLDAASGKLIWSKNLKKELGAQPPRWGFASSPLIDGNLAIYNVGSAGVALDKRTGKIVWKSNPSGAGYASPLVYNVGNQRGVALFTMAGVAGLNPANGRLLWQHPWQTPLDVNAADPIFAGDTVFISSGYNRGCALIRVSGGTPSALWENRNMRNHFHSCVLIGGSLYGNDQNTLKCIDLKTGAERWQQRGMGMGGLTAANGHLIILTARGVLLIVKATPEKYTELARAQVLGGTCWTDPVLANGRIFCRNHEGELVCLDVRR